MTMGFEFSAFDRATDPLFSLLTQEQTRAIAAYCGDEKVKRRVEELAVKCNAGQLSDDERAEYDGYANANHLIDLLREKARRRLVETSAGSRGTESLDARELAAARRLKMKTPPNNVLLGLAKRATVPSEIADVQEERPW